MHRVKLKSGIVIIIYSLILSLVLGFGVYRIKVSFNNIENKENENLKAIIFDSNNIRENSKIYEILANENYNQSFNSNEKFVNNIKKDEIFLDLNKIAKNYLSIGFKDILIITTILFFIIISSSIGLWIILNKIHDKEIENISKNLNEIGEDFNPYNISKGFGLAYENIKDRFKENLEDYKKLNSYLSHEQKNAIAILKTNLEIDSENKYMKLIDNINESIDDIVTLSEVKSKEEMIPVDVSLICANIYDIYRKSYKNISFDFDEENDTIILAKERWIYRAVSNLVDNAVKYGENKEIKLSIKTKYNSVIIEVKDNGIGMKRDFIENIFDNKYRINDLKKDGYGIGLSLVAHVCDLCNGIVVVESELNKGSSFYLSFLRYVEK